MAGIEIKRLEDFDGIDKSRFKQLIESGFGKELVPWYFDYVNPQYICLALDGDSGYAGAIVVEAIPSLPGVHYLDKIVANSNGNGIGSILWAELECFPKLVWRTRQDNLKAIDFYEGKYDGKATLAFPGISSYIFYYRGLTQQELPTALQYAIEKKPTLIPTAIKKRGR